MSKYKKIEDFQKEEFDSLVGKPCKVYVSSRWHGAKTNEPCIWLCGKITKVSWGKDDIFKKEGKYPAFYVYIRKCTRLNVGSLENSLFLPSSVEGSILVKVN
jgi:hypothetical protein